MTAALLAAIAMSCGALPDMAHAQDAIVGTAALPRDQYSFHHRIRVEIHAPWAEIATRETLSPATHLCLRKLNVFFR